MGRPARVTSIDALQTMAAAMKCFGGDATGALDDLDMEIQRALEWIHHDRKEHWAQEVRRGEDRVSEARVQLQQAMTARRIAEHEPSCVDEKRALERAKRRLEIAQEKRRALQHWESVIEHGIKEYQAGRAQLVGWLETDLPRALAALGRMTGSLESYVALEVPGGEMPQPPGTLPQPPSAPREQPEP